MKVIAEKVHNLWTSGCFIGLQFEAVQQILTVDYLIVLSELEIFSQSYLGLYVLVFLLVLHSLYPHFLYSTQA